MKGRLSYISTQSKKIYQYFNTLPTVYKFACMMVFVLLTGVVILRNYILLWIQVTFGGGTITNQTIPFFEALAVLDQMQTNQEIDDRLILDDEDFKKNMGIGSYYAEFSESPNHLNDRVVVTHEGRKYYYKAGYLKKNAERVKYMNKKGHKGVAMEYPLGLRLLMSDRPYLYYITQDLGMRYSYLYNLYDNTPIYIHGELVYSYLGNNIFFTYDHELPYEFMLLNNQNVFATREAGGFIRNIFVDGRYIYMYIDDFQGQSRIDIYDAKNIAGLYKIPFGSHDTARIGFKPPIKNIMIQGYVINKLYLYIKYYDIDSKHTSLKKIDLIANKEIASLEM